MDPGLGDDFSEVAKGKDGEKKWYNIEVKSEKEKRLPQSESDESMEDGK